MNHTITKNGNKVDSKLIEARNKALNKNRIEFSMLKGKKDDSRRVCEK